MTDAQSKMLSGYIADGQSNGWNKKMDPQNVRRIIRDVLLIFQGLT